MKDLFNALSENMIAQAKLGYKRLKEQGEATLPQLFAECSWTNSKGEEFRVQITMGNPWNDVAKHFSPRNYALELRTIYEGKSLVMDVYRHLTFKEMAEIIASEEFLTHVETYVRNLAADDGENMKERIRKEGMSAIQPVMEIGKAQMKTIKIPFDCPLTVGGKTLSGLDGIGYKWQVQTDSSHPYIIDRSKRFPCFDAEDYATELRFYRNFLICESKEDADKKAKVLERLPTHGDFCLVNEDLPADMRPMVYYMDGSKSMIVAY